MFLSWIIPFCCNRNFCLKSSENSDCHQSKQITTNYSQLKQNSKNQKHPRFLNLYINPIQFISLEDTPLTILNQAVFTVLSYSVITSLFFWFVLGFCQYKNV